MNSRLNLINIQSTQENEKITIYTRSAIRHLIGNVTEFYEIQEIIGEGAYGCVRKVLHKELQIHMAMKSIMKSYVEQSEFKDLLQEVEILRKLDHPNILKINEVIEDSKCYHIITELCTGGELLEKIIENKKLEEFNVVCYMHQIFSAVFYCHSHGVVHRDIKPENLLLEERGEDSYLKVIDFGISKLIDSQRKFYMCGKPFYSAPETFDGEFSDKSDIWSCGVVMYLMLCGYLPFRKKTNSTIKQEITNTKLLFPEKEWSSVSNEARALLIRLLDKDPANRPSAELILKNVWFAKYLTIKHQKVHLKSVDNLKQFQCQTKVQQAALEYIVSHLMTVEEIKFHKDTFLALDLDSDGKISANEILDAIQDFSSSRLEEVPSILKRCDSDQSGYIDYTEFLSASMDWKFILSTKKLETAFKAFDLNGNGKLDIDELRQMLGGIDEVGYFNLISQIDTNGDGEIDFDEFKEICLRIPTLFEINM